MVKNLNLIGNSTASPSAHPSIWCQNALMLKRLGAESSRVINKFGAETEMSRAESFRCRSDLVPKSLLVARMQLRL